MPEQPPTLRDMVNAARSRDRSLTFRKLAARAVDPETGKRASFSLFNDLSLGRVDRMPYDYHLRAIAAALGVPYERVWRAAIQEWAPPPADAEAETAEEKAERLAKLTEELLGELRQQRAADERGSA